LFNTNLILKTIDVINKVEINSLIRLERGSKDNLHYSVFRVLHIIPSYKEIQYGVRNDQIIRLLDEFYPKVLPYTHAISLKELKFNMVKHAVDGFYFSDIDLINENEQIIKL